MKNFKLTIILAVSIIFKSTQKQIRKPQTYYVTNTTEMELDLYNSRQSNTTNNDFQSKCNNESITSRDLLRSYRLDLNEILENRIVGGEATTIEKFPYSVLYGYGCGGGILHPKWIITAAHCGCLKTVYVGSTFRGRGRPHEVYRCLPHPAYLRKPYLHEMDFDIQLIELQKPIEINHINTSTIGIGRRYDVKPDEYITVTGWGYQKDGGPTPPKQLRMVQVPIIKKSICQAVNAVYYRGTLTPRMFCAGFKQGGHDACQGDSGGVAVSSKYRILGIVSFGVGCALPGVYGVYTDVTKFRRWIELSTGLEIED